MKTSVWVHIATLGPIGYLVASGTSATVVTMPIVYLLRNHLATGAYLLLLFVVLLCAVHSINCALEYFKDFQDPSQVVIDEVLGCLVTFYAIPICWQTMVAGFVLFRLFDITKWFGIARVERLVGAWGVLMDDVLAGALANVIMQVAYYFIVGLP